MIAALSDFLSLNLVPQGDGMVQPPPDRWNHDEWHGTRQISQFDRAPISRLKGLKLNLENMCPPWVVSSQT